MHVYSERESRYYLSRLWWLFVSPCQLTYKSVQTKCSWWNSQLQNFLSYLFLNLQIKSPATPTGYIFGVGAIVSKFLQIFKLAPSLFVTKRRQKLSQALVYPSLIRNWYPHSKISDAVPKQVTTYVQSCEKKAILPTFCVWKGAPYFFK